MSDIHFGIAPAPERTDYLSALPQELIEEIGLLTCAAPFTGDPSEPFYLERHRMRSLYALSLVSKQFHQIFSHRLYLEPLIVDTQDAPSLTLRNSASLWVNLLSYSKGPFAQRFTLWRPCPEEIRKVALNPTEPFLILMTCANICELTLSGNFARCRLRDRHSWSEASLTPDRVPHLSSVRIIDVDDAEILNTLLVGIAHKINTLVIHPSSTGLGGPDMYNPRSVYTALRPTLEGLTALEALTVSLPSVKINHCNHGHKLLQKTLLLLPNKVKLKHFTVTLPLFDCRSVQWLDASDSEDDDEQDARTIDHAWFWMTLQNFLSVLTDLSTFTFTGSMAPEEIRRKIMANSPKTNFSFVKAEFKHRTCPHRLPAPPSYPFSFQVPPAAVTPAAGSSDEFSYGDLFRGPPQFSVQGETPTTPASIAHMDPPTPPIFSAHHTWSPSPDPYPQPLPVETTPEDAWSHISTYEGMSAPFSDSNSPFANSLLPTFSYTSADTLASTSFDNNNPEPASPRWQEAPLSQDFSVDSGFASQENTSDSVFAWGTTLLEREETNWPPPALPRLEREETSWPPPGLPRPSLSQWDWYIDYD
jgi:hypothetical protein